MDVLEKTSQAFIQMFGTSGDGLRHKSNGLLRGSVVKKKLPLIKHFDWDKFKYRLLTFLHYVSYC